MLFEESIAKLIPSYTKEKDFFRGETLSIFDYKEELRIKNEAFLNFWKSNRLALTPQKIIASPKPRAYRTTTKRRILSKNDYLQLDKLESLLEPEEHNGIYRLLFEKLKQNPFKFLASALNWIIIRGTYDYRVVIFNIKKIDGPIVRNLKIITKVLAECSFHVTGVYAYVDTSASDYYLELNPPKEEVQFKQLLGPNFLTLSLQNCNLRYPVTGFSQVNESQIPNLIKVAGRMLKLTKEEHFLDLYCGYGLFSFALGDSAKTVLGVEWGGKSIEFAKMSAKHLKKDFHFIAGTIDENFVETRLPRRDIKEREKILLDPPRKGCKEDVIKSLALRRPNLVCHLFCGTDEIPKSIREWERYGYRMKEIQPIDMFPGTPHLETIVKLEKK